MLHEVKELHLFSAWSRNWVSGSSQGTVRTDCCKWVTKVFLEEFWCCANLKSMVLPIGLKPRVPCPQSFRLFGLKGSQPQTARLLLPQPLALRAFSGIVRSRQFLRCGRLVGRIRHPCTPSGLAKPHLHVKILQVHIGDYFRLRTSFAHCFVQREKGVGIPLYFRSFIFVHTPRNMERFRQFIKSGLNQNSSNLATYLNKKIPQVNSLLLRTCCVLATRNGGNALSLRARGAQLWLTMQAVRSDGIDVVVTTKESWMPLQCWTACTARLTKDQEAYERHWDGQRPKQGNCLEVFVVKLCVRNWSKPRSVTCPFEPSHVQLLPHAVDAACGPFLHLGDAWKWKHAKMMHPRPGFRLILAHFVFSHSGRSGGVQFSYSLPRLVVHSFNLAIEATRNIRD